MAIGGAFLGGGAEIVPAGFCKLELEILTEDRANLTATFTIKGTSTYTVTAGADGRAVYTVPSGQTYTVSVNTTGYDNIASQTVVAESGTVRYVRFEALGGRVKRSGDTMSGNLSITKNIPQVLLNNTNLALADRLTTDTNIVTLTFNDKNSRYIGGVVHRWTTTGLHRTLVEAIGEDGTLSQVGAMVSASGEKYGFAPSWSVGTNDNSDKVLTIKMANSLPSLVHTTGNETIAGTKTFKSVIVGNLANVDATSTVTTRTDIMTLRAYNNSGNLHFFRKPNSSGIEINTRNKDGKWTSFLLTLTDSGLSYANAPSVKKFKSDGVTLELDLSDNSGKVVTTEWANAKFLPLDGSKAMTGGLVINTSYPRLDLVRNDYVHGTAPTSEKLWALARVLDNGTTKRTLMTNELKVNTGETFTYSTSVYDSNNKWHYPFVIKWAKDYSTVEVTAPTPTDEADNTTKIATTKWVNSASSVVHTTGNETIAGTKTFKNTIVRQFSAKAGEIPTSNIFIPTITMTGADGKSWGYLRGFVTANTKKRKWQWCVYKLNDDGTTSENAFIQLIADDGETPGHATAPTTPTNATSNEIATANWVNGKLATRVQKVTLNGTISDGVIVTTDIQANDTVFVSITTPSDISPITYAVDIPSTVEGAMLVRSSSHITQKSDGKLYSIDIYAQYRKTAWQIGIIQRGITDGGVSNPAVVSFYGHILRAG